MIKKILLVEDDALSAMTTSKQLAIKSYELLATVSTGEEALVYLSQNPLPDLIILDIHLSGKMDGIETALKIYKQFSLPIIFLTSFADDEIIRRLPAATPYAYLIKPSSTNELHSTIQTVQARYLLEEAKKNKEIENERNNRALQAMLDITRAGSVAESEAQFLQRCCKLVMDINNFRLVWIGYRDYSQSKNIYPIATAGNDEGYLEKNRISWGDNTFGKGPAGRAICTGKTHIVDDTATDSNFTPWKEEALKRDYKSLAAIPLFIDNNPFAVIVIYSSQIQCFANNNIYIYQKLSEEISFNLQNIRLRQQNQLIKNETNTLKEFYEDILGTINDGIIVSDKDDQITFINSPILKIFNTKNDHIIGLNLFQQIDKLNLKSLETLFTEAKSKLKSISFSGLTINSKTKERIFSGWVIPLIRNNRNTGLLITMHDESDKLRLEKEIIEISDNKSRMLGQDLHDGLGQLLTGISFMCKATFAKISTENSNFKTELDDIEKRVSDSIDITRSLARGLVNNVLSNENLIETLNDLACRTSKIFRIECQYTGISELHFKDLRLAQHLYFIAQEGVNNAIKHGNAGNIEIGLELVNENIVLQITDNGKFSETKMNKSNGLGLKIMNYRANLYGGNITINRTDNNLTRITCTIPSKEM